MLQESLNKQFYVKKLLIRQKNESMNTSEASTQLYIQKKFNFLINQIKQFSYERQQVMVHEFLQDLNIFPFSQCQKQNLIILLIQGKYKNSIQYLSKLIDARNFNNTKQNKLYGGGQCCSRQGNILEGINNMNQLNTINKFEDKNQEIDVQFKKLYNQKVANQSHISEVVEKSEYASEIAGIFDKILNKKKEQIIVNASHYRMQIIEIFNLCLLYIFSGAFDIDKDDQNQIIKKIDAFLDHIKQNINLFACQDLEFLYQFLYDLTDLEFDQNSKGYKNVQLIAEFFKLSLVNNKMLNQPLLVNEKLQLNQENGKTLSQFLLDSDKEEKLDNIWQIVGKANEKIRSFTKDSMAKQISIVLALRAQRFQKYDQVKASDEMIFFIEQVIEYQNIQASSHLIIYLLVQIHYILLKNQQDNGFVQEVNQLFEVNEQLSSFLRILKQQQTEKQSSALSQSFLLFFKFTVTDITYRFISNQILMIFYSILAQKQSQEKEILFTHLVYQYITERSESIKLIFLANQYFVSDVNEQAKYNPSRLAGIVVNYQSKRKEELIKNKISPQEIDALEETIKDESDFLQKISLRMIEKWELNARQRLEKGIAQKDDILLEVQDLYIDQNISYISGNQLFEEQNNKQTQKNAIDSIISSFLLPHENIEKEQKNLGNSRQNCKILGILAEGGTGKSMLFKRLETILMKEKNQKIGSQLNYITFLIKCNNLDSQNPSLDDYFITQGLEKEQINLLKQIQSNKLILLDGYDEYTGNYFRIYSQLKLSEWKNTVVIVSSRMEKLSETDAQLYFSIDDSQMIRDDTSYCIVKLQEFQRKDVDQYCKKFFEKQIEKQKQIQIKESQFLDMMDMCLKNKQLEQLLFLPINLYLFTRMVINKKQEELSDIISNINDQIQIQEIFFQEQFQREAVDFIDQIQESQANKKLVTEIISSYFVYFQSVAMQMFINKSFKANFLQLNKEEINFTLQPSICKLLKQEDQKSLELKIVNYMNSKIITKVKDNESQEIQFINSQIIEFKHKSLFEYFVARAFRYDFDVHGEQIHQLEISKLTQFNINKKIIMTSDKNKSEQQILIKFYKLIKEQIENDKFIENYKEQQISKTNRFIQYLRRSTIKNMNEKSEIDIGASNLLSALFVSKFAYEDLSFTKCSFSQSYLPSRKSFKMNFDQCNFNNSYLENQNLCSFENSLIENALLNSFTKEFDLNDVFQSNGQIFLENKIYSISKTGYINIFSMEEQKLLQSQKIFCQNLKGIFLEEKVIITYSEQTFFEINPLNLEVMQSYKFPFIIQNIQSKNHNQLVTLENTIVYYGSIKNGFKEILIEGQNPQLTKEYIISCKDSKMLIYDNQTFELKQTLDSINFEYLISNQQNTMFITLNDRSFKVWQKAEGEKLMESINYVHDDNLIPKTCCLSDDGKYFVTLNVNEGKIWDVQNNFELVKELGFIENISSFHFSRDSKYLGISSLLHVSQILDVKNNFQVKYSISAHSNAIDQMDFSPDGKYIATCDSNSFFRIWDATESYTLLHKIQGHDYKINCLSFSPNGIYLATCSKDQYCKIWNVQKQFEIVTQIKQDQEINYLAFSPDNKYLVLNLNDKTFKVLNPKNNFSVHKIIDRFQEISEEGFSSNMIQIIFSADSKYFVAQLYKDCLVFDVEQNFEFVKQLPDHSSSINKICFSNDKKYMVTVNNKVCNIWKVCKEFNLIKTLAQHQYVISSVNFSPDSKYLLTLASYEGIMIWDSEKEFELINVISDRSLTSVIFNPKNSKYFATTCNHGTFQIWNIEKSYESIKNLQTHNSQVIKADFYSQNKNFVTYGKDKCCRVWSVDKGFELSNSYRSLEYKIQSSAFSPDGRYLALGIEGNICQIWNLEQSFKLIKHIQYTSTVENMVFSFDGKYLAILIRKQLNILSIEKDFENIKEISIGTFYSCPMTFSRDDNYFSIGEQNTCRVWDVKSKFKEIYVNYGHRGKIYQVFISLDIKYYASISFDKRCIISDIKNNFKMIQTITSKKDLPLCGAFTLDSKYLLIGFSSNRCEIYNIQKDFQLSNILYNYEGSINYITFSECGKYLAISDDIGCKIYDSVKGFKRLDETQVEDDKNCQLSLNKNLFDQLYVL